jgi:glycogen synthase
MKILMVSNLYPPYFMGGYELRCALAAEGLQRIGHDVKVLTSSFGVESAGPFRESIDRIEVERVLGQYHHGARSLEGWPLVWSFIKPQLRDVRHFVRIVEGFNPDIINWWSIGGLTKAILSVPRLRAIPDVFCIEDDWIVEEQKRRGFDERPPWSVLWGKDDKPWYWRPVLIWLMERWKRRLLRLGVETAAVPFRPAHVCFVSESLRADYKAMGYEFPSSEVIYGGVPVSRFFFRRESLAYQRGPLRLLYAGQITRDRGLHAVIEALKLLSPAGPAAFTLTVVGDSLDLEYQREIRERIVNLELSSYITLVGKKGYEEMPEIYRSHDVLIMPSMRKEGLPLTMMEAMLAGCAVVTTGSGGAIEIARLADLPLFPKGDAGALKRILEEFRRNRENLEGLAKQGQEVALREFSSDRMVRRFAEMFAKLHEATQKGERRSESCAERGGKVGWVAQERL